MTLPAPLPLQRQLVRLLLGWSALSVLGGLVLARQRDPFRRGLGLQWAAWGAVDGVIALVGLREYRRNLAHLRAGKLRAPHLSRLQRLLEVILWVNSLLDVGYLFLGSRLLNGGRFKQGTGWGIISQGAFLLLLDASHAILLRWHRA
jgi:hypothetical protein